MQLCWELWSEDGILAPFLFLPRRWAPLLYPMFPPWYTINTNATEQNDQGEWEMEHNLLLTIEDLYWEEAGYPKNFWESQMAGEIKGWKEENLGFVEDEEGMDRGGELEGGSPGAKLQALAHLPGEHMPKTFFFLSDLFKNSGSLNFLCMVSKVKTTP